MTDHLVAVERLDERMRACIELCSDCHELCAATLEHCLRQGGEYVAGDLIGVLQDCAQACATGRDFMLRASPVHHLYCRACAHLCGSCASACEKFPDDPVMRACAELCRRCMQSCREMGGATRH